jgi:DUF4097 and DUF4098 domain-containing protein YvlB
MFLPMLFLMVTSAYPSSTHDQWSKTYQAAQMPNLVVRTSDANIRVDAWDNPTIEATVTTDGYRIGDGGVSIRDNQAGNRIELEVKLPRDYFHVSFGRRNVDVVLHVPRSLNLDLHTGDGAIDINGVSGQMALRSGDGHIEVNGVDGKLDATAGDGHVKVSGRFDQLDLRTGDGSIEAEVLSGSNMSSGWTLHTGDGHLIMRVPETFSADVDIHTNDGHIDLDLPVAVLGRTENHEIHGRLNQGGQLLTLRAGDGSIHLAKL